MPRFTGDRLVLASHNRGKIEEIVQLIEPIGITVISAGDLGLPEPEETEATFVGNARLKAHAAARASGLPALSDDSGLEVESLNGAPGVYTADWATTPCGRDFGVAMQRTWEAIQATKASPPYRARFCCALVLAWPDGKDVCFQGFVQGFLTWPPRGDKGHGYDPIFLPEGSDVTYGEMDRWEKNASSHRAAAFRQIIEGCFT